MSRSGTGQVRALMNQFMSLVVNELKVNSRNTEEGHQHPLALNQHQSPAASEIRVYCRLACLRSQASLLFTHTRSSHL